MIERELFLFFLDRLPTYDPAWPDEIRATWMECYLRLWRWGCRLMVLEAVENYH